MRFQTSPFTIHWRCLVAVQTCWSQTKVYTSTFSVDYSKFSLCSFMQRHNIISFPNDALSNLLSSSNVGTNKKGW